MEITKEQFSEYTNIIKEVVHGELSDYEYNRILEIVQKARTENELNKLVLDYKEQIKQSFQVVTNTIGKQLTPEQEKLVRNAIENSRGDKSALMYELLKWAENMKRGDTKPNTRLQEAFRYIESSIERELAPNEVQVVVRIVERNDGDRTSLMYELNKYKMELLEKDFEKSIGQNRPPKRLTENNKLKKHNNKSKTRKKRNIKNHAKTDKNRKGKKLTLKRILAGLAATTLAAAIVGGTVATVVNTKENEPVEFSNTKIEELQKNESQENIEIMRLNYSNENELKIELLSCDQVKNIAMRARNTLQQLLETKINETLNESDYKYVGYGYDDSTEIPYYYIHVGDKTYTNEKFFPSKKISGEITDIVKRMLKLEKIQLEPNINKLEKDAKYLEETIEVINELKNKDINASDKKIEIMEKEKSEVDNGINKEDNER